MLWRWAGTRGRECWGREGGFRLYRLVASATLPPANQVRDKHEDDKEAECHAHSNGHQKAQIRVQEALVS